MVSPRVQVRMLYFNRDIIRSNWSRINRTPITRAGNLVRSIARGSIRSVTSQNPSAPGTPPRSRTVGKPFKLIFSVPNSSGTNATVGMVGFGTRFDRTPVPGLHEHGGVATTKIAVRSFSRKTGKRGRPKKVKLVDRVPKAVRVRYPQRPFMRPALQRAKHRLPELWRNTIR